MINCSHYHSPIGELLLAEEDDALIGLWIKGQKYYPSSEFIHAISHSTPVLTSTQKWLDRYFAGQKPPPEELPLAPLGTPFQQKVWNALCRIPYGQVTTYGQIAADLGISSAQAIGGAIGRNPISIIIPCHRVVGAGGRLTGYAAGIEKKQFLLSHEGVDLSCF